MNDDLKQKLEAAGLSDVVKLFEGVSTQVTTLTTELETAKKTITEKDAIIEQKNRDLVGTRKKMETLKELTEAEKATMSEKEIQLHETIRQMQQGIEERDKAISEFQTREVESRRDRIFTKIAGKEGEHRAKLEEAYKRIVGHDAAQTEEDITKFATEAWNMLGAPKRDPVNDAFGGIGGGDAPGTQEGQGFSETTEGKAIAEQMGLTTEPPATPAT